MLPLALSLDHAVAFTGAIAAAGIVYDGIEFYVAQDAVLEGFFDWKIVRSRYYIFVGRPLVTGFFNLLFEGKRFVWLTLAHGLAAVLFPLAVLEYRPLAALLSFLVLVVHSLSNIRLLVGRDGADQMQTVVWAGLLGFCLPVADWARIIGPAFIAAQVILSYFVSGFAKAVSSTWRTGQAITLITRMATYCPRDLSSFLTQTWASYVLCWMTIAFEVMGPFLLLAGPSATIVFFVAGVTFHVGIAIAMGLTTFVFAFLSTYPLLYYFAQRLWW